MSSTNNMNKGLINNLVKYTNKILDNNGVIRCLTINTCNNCKIINSSTYSTYLSIISNIKSIFDLMISLGICTILTNLTENIVQFNFFLYINSSSIIPIKIFSINVYYFKPIDNNGNYVIKTQEELYSFPYINSSLLQEILNFDFELNNLLTILNNFG